MNTQLHLAETALDRRVSLQQDSRLCLVLVTAALSGLAALSPSARTAIETVLDEALAAGIGGEGEAAATVADLRDRLRSDDNSEAAQIRRLEEALREKADGLANLSAVAG
jgi:hypothetical protein